MSQRADGKEHDTSRRRAVFVVLLVVLLVVLAGVVIWMVRGSSSQEPGAPSPYVGRAVCAECHEEATRQWTGSHHDLAMDHATPLTVLGDFENVRFEHHGTTSRFFRKDGRFFVHTVGRDGEMADFEVKYVFGVEPLQQYLIELEDGHVHCLQVTWDTQEKRWFHIQDEPIPHDDPLHWTGPQFNWNFMCAECHSTNLQRDYDADSHSYATTWSEIDVSCEACHGPGEEHVALARKLEERGEEWQPGDPMGLAVRLKVDDPSVQVEHCARCHARRTVVTADYAYGHTFLDHYGLRLLVEPLYYADGQILDEVYVYGSFLQAKKHGRGVRCTDCHDAHSARLKHERNTVCTQCHTQSPTERFPTLQKKRYDDRAHHFHEPGKEGSFCVDCHMEARTYMGVDPRRDHSFRIPRPDLTRKIGTPNACSNCHKDKTLSWVEEAIAKWYPDSEVGSRHHYGEAFAAARAGKPEGFEALLRLLADKEQTGIVRATAVHYLTRYQAAGALPPLAQACTDEEPLVRAEAVRGIGALVGARAPEAVRARKIPVLKARLTDPVRLVRVEAARALADVPLRGVTTEVRGAFDAALREYVARQEAIADRPDGYLNLGAFYEVRGDPNKAESAYRRALEIDPNFVPVRFNLATLLNTRGRNREAEAQLQTILSRDKENGEAWYSLGLLQAEMGRFDDAALSLTRAARLLPTRARIAYNQGLVFQRLGQMEQARAALTKAHRADATDPQVLHALIEVTIERCDWAEAERLVGEMKRLLPRSPLPGQLRARLEAARKR